METMSFGLPDGKHKASIEDGSTYILPLGPLAVIAVPDSTVIVAFLSKKERTQA